MSNTEAHPEFFLPLRQVAARLGVPATWLQAEAEANRVPHLRIGKRLLLNQQTVEQALLDLATKASEDQRRCVK